jgi:hypothetical protein
MKRGASGEALTMFDSLYFYAAVIGGTVLACQFVLMLLGWSDDGGADAAVGGADGADFSGGHVGGDMHHMGGDVHADPTQVDHHHAGWAEAGDADLGHPGGHWFYEVLSLRTISAAVTFFGLGGRMALAYGARDVVSLVVALAAGWAALYAVYWLFLQVYKVQHAGNENVRLAVGLPATVYVPIPGSRGGVGKVTFRLQDRTVEYQAVTEEGERLATGEKVVVDSIINSDTVCVSRAPMPAQT